jgi:NAD(P)-dependent dehydrogenase (short-subunit alcohol dehydrogenase family)
METTERVVVISGATGGLGSFAARSLAQNGLVHPPGHPVKFALVSTNPEKLAVLGESLQIPAGRWLAVAQDISQPDAGAKVLEAVLAKFGRADILLHLVGGWKGGKTVPLTPPADLAFMLQQHVWTTFYLAQAFVPQMLTQGWGRVIVISSANAGSTPANSGVYSASKAAEEALTLTLAEELKNSGVTANVLRVRTIDVNHERDREVSPKTASWTTPEEIMAAVQYLCSDDASSVNGARIPLYGSP